ncbi:polysaccharide deacetylase family protein [Microbacterium kyungheense]|uniref:Polysaccharide deacetylase n=1 Tax=Microbacterium kyungheense TaxID=1263636 RepID=A0A543ERT1_9MICO|nr:polysaccharide deacetylase family protein [Microbacterium kyungheense]TQM24288.1 polysaccharide deacetylase [Microbacterium kyungheense]
MKIGFGLGIRARLDAVGARVRNGVQDVRLVAERQALASFGNDRARPGGRILCYHSVGQPAWGVNDVAPQRFRQQIEAALEAGYRFVPASELARTGGGPRDLSLTFDDGLKSVLATAAPILASYDIPFSVYVVSGWSEDGLDGNALSWGEVTRLAELGAEIGNHSATHPDFSRIDKEQARQEIAGAEALIEKRTGIRTSAFAIPWGQSGNWPSHAHETARELGYDVIYAQAEETRAEGTIARTFVTSADSRRIFDALLRGRYDSWEEWVWRSPAR